MTFEKTLDTYLRARFTLIVTVTMEEERLLGAVRSVCERLHRPGLAWDVAEGFTALTGWNGAPPVARDPLTALEQIDRAESDALFVLRISTRPGATRRSSASCATWPSASRPAANQSW